MIKLTLIAFERLDSAGENALGEEALLMVSLWHSPRLSLQAQLRPVTKAFAVDQEAAMQAL